MPSGSPARADVRAAEAADLSAIIAIAMATGQDENWDEVYPGYIRHLMTHGSLLVAERAGGVTGFGATVQIGTGPQAICMLTDLFVAPAAHGTGTGRAILGALWTGEQRRMTFSSLHANALPLYTSFGVDAWWPLLYLRGDVRRLAGRSPPRNLSSPRRWNATGPGSTGPPSIGSGPAGRAERRSWRAWMASRPPPGRSAERDRSSGSATSLSISEPATTTFPGMR